MKQLIIFSGLFLSLMGFSQGIEFEHGSWKEVLEKAKQTNKPIFVDVYTSWCGPCKKMNKDIFPLAEVGKAYNTGFVCYQIDAEKGEGVEIAKKYEIKSYPTYLFIEADGTLFSRAGGYMDAEKFIAISKAAFIDLNDPKPLSEWEKEYAQKKADPAFMANYIDKRLRLGKTVVDLFDEYLALVPNDQRASDKIIQIYQSEISALKINSLAYKNLQENAIQFFPKLGGYVYTLLTNAVLNSFKIASETKDEQLLEQVVAANEKLPKTPQSKIKEELYMSYYKQTNDVAKYIRYATTYCNTSLMAISADSIAMIDKKASAQFNLIKPQLSGQIDSTELMKLKDYLEHATRNKYSDALNNIAWDFFEKTSDKDALENALDWSKRSLEIFPGNHMSIDTYANLLYKLGHKEEAITNEKEAIRIAKEVKADAKAYEDALAKMKSGK